MRLQAEQPGHGLVEIKNAPGFIHHQHAVFDGVEQRFEKAALARQPLHDGLQAFRVEPPDAAENLVEKTGFGRRHAMRAEGGLQKVERRMRRLGTGQV